MSADTFPELLAANAARYGDAPALREKRRGIWRTTTWAALADEARLLAAALAARGVAKGDRVLFLGENRPRLFAAMVATHALGAVAVPLFPDAVASEIAPTAALTEPSFVFAENQEQVDKILEILPGCSSVRGVVYDDDRSMGHYRAPQLVQYDALLDEGRGAARRGAPERRCGPDDPAFVFLTSGATGPARATTLTHAALTSRARALAEAEGMTSGDVTIAYLPPGWIAQTLFAYMLPLTVGSCVCCPESSDTLLADMREAAPTVLLATPRMLDTVVSQISLRMQDTGGLALRLYDDAVALARRSATGRSAPLGQRMKAGLYEALVYAPLRDSLGMSRIKAAYSSGDAIDPSVMTFFRSLGVNLKQLYGTTETGFVTAVQRDGAVKPDTVGEPLDGVEVRIAPDREILVRSRGLFTEYLGDPEATAAARDDGGWLRTGDLGGFDDDGQLHLIDRVRDAGTLKDGAAYMPRPIENKIKFSPYIREAIAVGAGRDFVCALVDINTVAVGRWADGHAIPYTGHADLASQEAVYDMVADFIAEVNAEIAADPELSGCQIRRFALLQEELSPDDGVLTRTGKIRRDAVAERFAPLIDAIYAGRDSAAMEGGDGAAEAFGDAGPSEIRIRDARLAAGGPARRAA